MIIIPDIHGRTFWKSAIEQKEKDEKIIFLGDYLDHYDYEKNSENELITPEKAIENFKEILNYKKNNNNIILLQGNHDYIHYNLNSFDCRKYYKYEEDINMLFKDNLKLFSIAHYEIFKNQPFLFTHAGVMQKWLNRVNQKFSTIENLVHWLNTNPWAALRMCGPDRGGFDPVGSCLWVTVTEFDTNNYELPNIYQIFGHTQLRSGFIGPYHADLDCRKAFKLNEDTLEISPL